MTYSDEIVVRILHVKCAVMKQNTHNKKIRLMKMCKKYTFIGHSYKILL